MNREPQRERWSPTTDRPLLWSALRVLAASMILARAANAQVVMGTVVQPDSATALASAIVVASDARGATAARTLTDGRGAFVLRLQAAGTYSLAVLRIGYRPTRGPRVTLGENDTSRVRIVAASSAISLAALQVSERQTCRVQADTGLMVARVWEEARKAMVTSQLTSGSQPLIADWIEYDRMLDSTGRVVRKQTVRSSRHPTTHAFRSVSPRVLSEKGFVVEDAVGVTFHAPDADVLLSDVFVQEHCFRLAESTKTNAGLIGVTFSPTRDRRDMREIEGTLWVDRASSELRLLEYRYLNLPDPSNEAHPGGRVEFLRLADGSWLIGRWHVRMPRVGMRELKSADGMRRTTMSLNRAYLQAIQVTGGEVTRAARGDSVLLRTAGPSVVVQLTSIDPLMPLDGATLTLDGTNYSATGDSLGRISLTPVLEGRYRASIRTPIMQQLGVPPLTREIETRADAGADSVALPSGKQVLTSVCPQDSIREDEGMLHGRVLDDSNKPAGGLFIRLSWLNNLGIMESHGATSITVRERVAEARSDAFGYWRVCGLPRDLAIKVTVDVDSLVDQQRVELAGRPFTRVDLVLRRKMYREDLDRQSSPQPRKPDDAE